MRRATSTSSSHVIISSQTPTGIEFPTLDFRAWMLFQLELPQYGQQQSRLGKSQDPSGGELKLQPVGYCQLEISIFVVAGAQPYTPTQNPGSLLAPQLRVCLEEGSDTPPVRPLLSLPPPDCSRCSRRASPTEESFDFVTSLPDTRTHIQLIVASTSTIFDCCFVPVSCKGLSHLASCTEFVQII